MQVFNIKDMIKGWFVGDFEPSAFRTNNFEVGLHAYKKNNETHDHYHKESTEINLILSGKMIINGQTLKAGDIFILEPYVVSESCFLEDTQLVVVRTKSLPSDKYMVNKRE